MKTVTLTVGVRVDDRFTAEYVRQQIYGILAHSQWIVDGTVWVDVNDVDEDKGEA